MVCCDKPFLLSLFSKENNLNYLAHIFLSGSNPQVKVGNFIGDFVKGSQFNNYPDSIRQGIILHRKIDAFTDSHEVVKETVNFLRPAFGRYSAIIVDMYFDYFLAVNFSIYSSKSLHFFAFEFYFSAILNYKHLPVRVKGFIFHFVSSHRLYKYSTLSGLQNSLQIMANYKTSAIKPEKTIRFLEENRLEIESRFHLFFPDLVAFAKGEIDK